MASRTVPCLILSAYLPFTYSLMVLGQGRSRVRAWRLQMDSVDSSYT
jgi:hypothetical protein